MPLLAATVTPTFHRAGAGIRRAAPRRAVRAVAFVGEGNGVKLQPPVIDAEEFLRKERTLFLPSNAVARSIADAGAEFGCFQLVNHGVSPQLLSDLQVCMAGGEEGGWGALPLRYAVLVKTRVRGGRQGTAALSVSMSKNLSCFGSMLLIAASAQCAEGVPGLF